MHVSFRNIFLVSEPALNRIGIFDSEDFMFWDWCVYPFAKNKFKLHHFLYPTNILCTKNGFVFILEKHQIIILDDIGLQPHQLPIKCAMAGLAEGEQGEVFTMQKDREGVTKVWRLSLDTSDKGKRLFGKELYWWHEDQVVVEVAQKFSQWQELSKCW